jgi:hypothetical protein
LTVRDAILAHRYSFVNDASDSVGGANGTLAGGTPAATINNGLTLPGTGTSGTPSGYVALPNGLVQGFTSVSVECWAIQNQANTWAEIWSFGINGGQENFAFIPSSPTPNMRVAFTPAPNGAERDIQSSGPMPSGAEQYIAVTYNNVSLVGDLYTNGVFCAAATLPDTTYSPGNYAATTLDTLGLDPYSGDAQFNGTIFEVRIWNGALSPLAVAVDEAAGPSVIVTNFIPTAVNVSVTNATLDGEETEQASVSANFQGVSGVNVTGAVTNWASANTNILTVSSSGLITAVGAGSTTISATVAGATGTSASITVVATPPIITQEPEATETILVGGTINATVENIGVGPFTYKWFFNNSVTPISGQSGSTLSIPNAQLANTGSYSAQIINASGSTNSTAVAVTVIAPTAYEADILSLNPLALWPLNETSGTTAFDVAGGYNGTYMGGVTMGEAGPTNSVFGGSALSANFDGGSGIVDIPVGPFNITGAITVAAWVNVPSLPTFSDIIGHSDTSWRLTITGAGDPAANDGAPPADATSTSSIVDGNWHLLAYTYDGTLSGNNGHLYVDGQVVANNSITSVPGGSDLDVWIGGAPDYGLTFGRARLFAGNIADVMVFDRALSGAEVSGLITGQSDINIKASGNKIVLTWPAGVLLQAPTINGPWTTNTTAVSPFTNSITGSSEFYRVLISH